MKDLERVIEDLNTAIGGIVFADKLKYTSKHKGDLIVELVNNELAEIDLKIDTSDKNVKLQDAMCVSIIEKNEKLRHLKDKIEKILNEFKDKAIPERAIVEDLMYSNNSIPFYDNVNLLSWKLQNEVFESENNLEHKEPDGVA